MKKYFLLTLENVVIKLFLTKEPLGYNEQIILKCFKIRVVVELTTIVFENY